MNSTLCQEKTFYKKYTADHTVLTIGLCLKYNLLLTTMNSERYFGKKDFGIRAWDKSVCEKTPHGALFYRNRQAGFDRLDRLGLPQAEREVIPLPEFMTDPVMYLKRVRTPNVYLNITPTEEGRKRKLGRKSIVEAPKELVAATINSFITEEISESDREHFLVNEIYAYHNYFAGMLLVAKNGQGYLLEMGRGQMADLAKGLRTPTHFMQPDPRDGLPLFSFPNPALQEATFGVMEALEEAGLAKISSLKRIDFTECPGYFEFSLIKKTGRKFLSPIFHDAILGEEAEPYDIPEFYLSTKISDQK